MKKISICGVFLVSLCFDPAFSGEYHGQYEGEIVGSWKIGNTSQGNRFKLGSDYQFTDANGFLWKVPKGQEVDGASIPRFLWSIVGPPYNGPYFPASVIHDYYCCMRHRTAKDTHKVFYDAMLALENLDSWHAYSIYLGVKLFGPDWTMRESVSDWGASLDIADLPTCEYKYDGEKVTGNNHYDFGSNISFQNVEREIELRKYLSMVKILKSTNGEFVDFSDGTFVAASLEKIDQRVSEIQLLGSDVSKFSDAEVTKLGKFDSRPVDAVIADLSNLNSVEVWDAAEISHFALTVEQEKAAYAGIKLGEQVDFEKNLVFDTEVNVYHKYKSPTESPHTQYWNAENIQEVFVNNQPLFREMIKRNESGFNGLPKDYDAQLLLGNPKPLQEFWNANPELINQNAVEKSLHDG